MNWKLFAQRVNRCKEAAAEVSKITGENFFLCFCEIIFMWYIYGASDEDYVTMELYRKNSREIKRWLTSKKNNRYLLKKAYDKYAISVFDDKRNFDTVFSKYMKHKVFNPEGKSENEIISFIKTFEYVIVKPADGACGRGVYKIYSNDESDLTILLKRIASGEHLIIEEPIIQHERMSEVNSSSVNTIRVITMLDRNRDVHVINTCAKFGGSASCISNTFGGDLLSYRYCNRLY